MVTSVAIPVLNGGATFERVLAGVVDQRLPAGHELELVVCDSGSTDGSLESARRHGAQIVQIARGQFGHGRTRNLLLSRSSGTHVAFLTQDAVPEDRRWLARLLSGFDLAADVGLVYGRYRPRADAGAMVAHELTAWFEGLMDDDGPRIDRLGDCEHTIPTRDLLGRRAFFTDANGCVLRAAWEQVPFRDVAYAEDQLLAVDMLRAGFAKVYVPDAVVEHSHAYSLSDWLRRSFDEARGLEEVYGWAPPVDPRTLALGVWGRVGGDLRWARRQGLPGRRVPELLVSATMHHLVRVLGGVLGGRHRQLPPELVRRLSLERRSS